MRLLLLFLAGLMVCVAAACDSGTHTTPTCNPACRYAYVCVNASCVSACNPACAAGQSCMPAAGDAAARCISDDGGSNDGAVDVMVDAAQTDTGGDSVSIDGSIDASNDGADLDAAEAASDASTPDGSSVGSDGGDSPSPSDGGMDSAMQMDVAADSASSCGHVGEGCCSGICVAGAYCTGTTCAAIVPVAGECVQPSDCTAPQVCSGPGVCGDRSCLQCSAPLGAGLVGAACTTATDCTTGLCLGGTCTMACSLASGGDAQCTGARAGWQCEELFFSYMEPDGGATIVSTLGMCRQGCQRASDCSAPAVCHGANNYSADRLDFVCGTVTPTGVTGAPCASGADCASFICLSGATSGTCTAPCTTAADCPSTAPRCVPINWLRPLSGGLQPGSACSP